MVGFASEEGAHAWLGLPFAKPPVGDLRWRAPRPPDAWEGTREALAYGPPCVQFAGPFDDGDGPRKPGSREDCLYLNVFAPRFAPGDVPGPGGRLPVMVWIHGGGNTIGDATLYDGSRLAASRDVVVVTVHYRLGVFGWLSHPALRGPGESPADASGNYGTLDLIRALAWVRDNAAAFGGDPDRVTVFGESAGGRNVASLLIAPPARGLFHRAVVQSGATRTTPRHEAEAYADDPRPGHARSSRELLVSLLLAEGAAADRAAAKAELAGWSDARVAETLRSQDADTLLALFAGDRLGGMYDCPQLVRDGTVLPDADPLDVIRAGGHAGVPVVLGTNREENKLFMMFSSPHVTRWFGIPVRLDEPRLYDLEAEYAAKLWKVRGVDDPARALRAAGHGAVWAYRFDWDDEGRLLWLDFGRLLGAAHGMEIPFVFGRLSFFGLSFVFDDDRRDLDRALSDAMTSYWTAFAAAGDPGRGRGGDLPRWQPFDGSGATSLRLDGPDDGGIRMTDETVTRASVLASVATDERFRSTAERCDLYASFVRWTDALSAEEYARVAGGLCRDHPLETGPE